VVDAQTVLGVGGRYVFVRPERGHLDALATLVDEGSVRVDVAGTFPLDQIGEAHRVSEEGHTRGKIALSI
jgi:NADPH:quinone reductase-like Zn-dependent oxidoreductase